MKKERGTNFKGIIISLVVVITMLLLIIYFDKIISFTGNVVNVDFNISIGAGNAPQIIRILNHSIADLTVNEAGNTNVSINFTVIDADGVSNMNTLANVSMIRAGEDLRKNVTCFRYQSSGNNANYTCQVDLWWFDAAGSWRINATLSDVSGNVAENSTQNLTINTLTGFRLGPGNVSFSTLNPAATNQTASNVIVLNNTGNQDIANGSIQVNSTTLYGENNNALALHSGNFTMSNNTGAGNPQCDLSGASASRMALVSGSAFTFVNGANMSRGNYTKQDGRGQEQLYLCLTLVGSELSQQSYSTAEAGAWIVKIS